MHPSSRRRIRRWTRRRGAAAVRADPDDPEAIADAIRNALVAARRAARARARACRDVLVAADGRDLPGGVPAIRVALDTTPLRQTRGGTARYVRGLRDHLAAEIVELSYPATSRLRTRRLRPALVPATARAARRRRPSLPDVPRAVSRDHAARRDGARPRRAAPSRSGSTAGRARTRRSRCRASSRAARRVIAVSEFTKRELVELLAIPESRIARRPERRRGRLHARRAEGRRRLRPRGRDARAAQEPRAHRACGRRRAARRRCARLGRRRGSRANVTWLPDASDEELAALYRGARCLVYASLYEGFGIPVAEALACGCPIVTTAGSPMADLAGGDAVLVDPTDVAAITRCDRPRGRADAAPRRELGRRRRAHAGGLRGGVA